MGVNFVRNKSSEDLRQTLAKAYGYIHRRTKMDIQEKMKELSDLFSKTGKELGEIVKQNEEFISEEIRKAEETIRKASEVFQSSTKKKKKNFRSIQQ